ncbi:hypothetical protein SAMN06269185_2591 [Natronoarchaeum philippinense]|uniref:Uncharacterized protein n=1 Tax=Natronoarchaeum philippinense TaxID=558529 RepID=A0A285P1Z7_NATPI|nr:hypothetical protein [Natronoarchaeum philippinense]SNZ15764.1 hypothetical protein SAMN06269185_2591 [Natronoarchaeum philippinense]
MTDDFSTGRRKLLQSAGAGGTALLAGCSERLGLAQNDSDGDGQREVGVVVAADQQALLEAQSEAQQGVQSGNLTQQEATEQYRQRQRELLEQAIESLTESLSSSVTVEQRYSQLGAVVISGPADALLDTLELESTQSLVLASRIEAAASSSTSANSS